MDVLEKDVKEEFRRILGQELRRGREKKHLSQPQLAKLAGIHTNTLYQYETGRTDITVLSLARLCSLLKINPTTILKKCVAKGQSNQHEENPAA